MKEFKSLLEDAEKLISYDADDQEAWGTSWKTHGNHGSFGSPIRLTATAMFQKDDPQLGSGSGVEAPGHGGIGPETQPCPTSNCVAVSTESTTVG